MPAADVSENRESTPREKYAESLAKMKEKLKKHLEDYGYPVRTSVFAEPLQIALCKTVMDEFNYTYEETTAGYTQFPLLHFKHNGKDGKEEKESG